MFCFCYSPAKNPAGERLSRVPLCFEQLIEKAKDFMDETADKIHKSEPYWKAGNSIEKATLNIFRKAGKWWGKL